MCALIVWDTNHPLRKLDAMQDETKAKRYK